MVPGELEKAADEDAENHTNAVNGAPGPKEKAAVFKLFRVKRTIGDFKNVADNGVKDEVDEPLSKGGESVHAYIILHFIDDGDNNGGVSSGVEENVRDVLADFFF